MKKFFCAIPLQPKGILRSHHYEAHGNSKLDWDLVTAFPILYPIRGYAVPGEEIRVVAVCTDNSDSRYNLSLFEQALREVCGGMDVPCQLQVIFVPEVEEVLTHVNTFQQLIDEIDDQDELFLCMTYGTKPLSEALRMAVQYGYRLKENTSIVCVVYGGIPRKDNVPLNARVYDMTALLQVDELVRVLAERKISKPEMILKNILNS